MGIADERIEKIRQRNANRQAIKDYDYSVRFFFIGWLLFAILSVLSSRTFGLLALNTLTGTYGRAEDMELIGFAFLATLFGVIGYFFGQLIALFILRHPGKKWRGNLSFGKHPVLFISLASLITFNLIFPFLLGLILSFKK